MRILALAMALAVVLALPSPGETAQKKKARVRSAPPMHARVQQLSYPSYSVAGSRTAAGTPCVAYTWQGCLGWDPDPNIRSMIDRDRGKDNR